MDREAADRRRLAISVRQQGPAAKAFEYRQWRALRVVESGNRNVNRLLEHVLA